MRSRAGANSRALLFVLGVLFWVVVLVGVFTGNGVVIGLAVVPAVVTAVGVIAQTLQRSRASNSEQFQLWSDGAPARAKVVSIGTRGGVMNGHPNVDFELEVSLPGEEPYRIGLTAMVSKLAIPRIQPGTDISVRVDRNDRSRILIDAALTPYGYDRER